MGTFISFDTPNTNWVDLETLVDEAKLDTENTQIYGNDVALDTALAVEHKVGGFHSDITVDSIVMAASGAITMSGQGILTVPQNGLHLLDSDSSHDLIINPTSNLTVDRTLSIVTGDADRTLTLSGDLTVESASLVNQDLTTDASPKFAGVSLTGITDGAVILGAGTSPVTSLAVTTDGSIIIGDGTAAPTTLNAFDSSTGSLKVANGGTGATDAATGLSNLGGIGAATTDTLTNKTINADGAGNALSNIDIGNVIAASQAEAEAGTDNTKLVTSLRVAQAIAALSSSGLTWVSKTTTYTAVAGDGIMASTSGGAWTLTLPASASIGDEIGICDQNQNFATANLTIARNGLNIMGLAEDLTVDTDNSNFSLIYSGDATDGWIIK